MKTLGIDLGTNSVGWAYIEQNGPEQGRIIAGGVRVFPAGMDIDDKGVATSHNLERRTARQIRKNLDRRSRRMDHLRNILTRAGFLPSGPANHQDAKWKTLLDSNPYELRAMALDGKIEPFLLGRAIYQLAQRRGFKSNRREGAKEDKELTQYKKEMAELSEKIGGSSARTLGEYLWRSQSPEVRIRGLRTQRSQLETEFDHILGVQAQHHPALQDSKFVAKLRETIFYQRPLKSAAKFIGFCELLSRERRVKTIDREGRTRVQIMLKGPRRCPIALPDAQEFRILQNVNNMAVVLNDGSTRSLTPEERTSMVRHLMSCEKATFAKLRDVSGIGRKCALNLENGDRKGVEGFVTLAKLRKAIGPAADTMSHDQLRDLVNDWLSIQDEHAFLNRLVSHYGLTEEQAEAAAEAPFEDDYLAFSRKALEDLLPLLREGKPLATCIKEKFGERSLGPALPLLPPALEARNPIVQRSLAELRKVVNAVIREYGKPDQIRIELARDLKKPSKAREAEYKKMRDRERQREAAMEKIVHEAQIGRPRRSDVEKALLWEECGGVCPYTGKHINFRDLFSEAPRFDIEHIIPFSRSFDDSFANKTLCDLEFNRNRKGNKTPQEAFGGTPDFDAMLQRVERFESDYREAKKNRFLAANLKGEEGFLDDFTSNKLNDTRHASVKAADVLERLYERDGKKHVQATNGQVTGFLRRALGLNSILGDGDVKTRDDHRHHFIDALVIALTTPSLVKALSDASKQGHRPGSFAPLPPPWPNMHAETRDKVAQIVASHRVSRRVNGALHLATHYGQITLPGTKDTTGVIRKPLQGLGPADVAKIIDPVVRGLVEMRLAELGTDDPKRAFKDLSQLPRMPGHGGKDIPIRRVRIATNRIGEAIGGRGAPRLVLGGNNHHLAVYEGVDKKGAPAWKAEVVSLREAMRRTRDGMPVVAPSLGDEWKLRFSLCIGDAVELQSKGERLVCVVRQLSPGDYNFKHANDARPAKFLGKSGPIRITSAKGLLDARLTKLRILPNGSLIQAND